MKWLYILLLPTILACSGKHAPLKPSFEDRKNILITHVADYYPEFSNGLRPSGYDGSLSDFGKYNYPKILAVFTKYGDTVRIWNDRLDIYSEKPTFHFNLLGLTRLLYQFPNAQGIQRNELEFLKRVFERTDSYNAWTAEGTENHVMMSRASGYLYAQLASDNYPEEFPEAKARLDQMKEWIAYYSKKVLEVGTGEWNSSIYGSYNIMPWINLYDFARDSVVRDMARAVLDYYAAELALNYFQGAIGGADMRGKGNFRSFQGSASYLGWIWFGDSPMPVYPENLNSGSKNATDLAQNIHAALSSYRPPPAILALNKHEGMFFNSKPDYLLGKASYIKHTHYKTESYHLGAGYFPYGGWSSGDFQIVSWKLLSRVDTGQHKSVQYLSGMGAQAPSKHFINGNMRSPFDQLVHHKNVLIQMTCVPDNAESISNEISSYFASWKQNWARDFKIRFPNDTYKQNRNPIHDQMLDFSTNASYLVLHANGYWRQHLFGERLVLELEKNWVIIQSINKKALNPFKTQIINEDTIQVLRTSAKKGMLCGFVLELVPKDQFPSIERIESEVLPNIHLTRSITNDQAIKYISSPHDVLNVTYNKIGDFTEPIFDWGYGYTQPTSIHQSPPILQPNWPSGDGHGKLATWSVNKKLIDLHEKWPVYSGDGVYIGNYRLEVGGPHHSYHIDYVEESPRFSSID